MACMLPQFKCPPHIHFRSHTHTNLFKTRQPVCFRVQCIMSSTSTLTATTTEVELEKLQLPSFEAHLNSVAADKPLTYAGAFGPPSKVNLESTLATEALIMREGAVIAAAASEAVTLAKAAAEVAKDASLMFSDKPEEIPSDADVLQLMRFRITDLERVSTEGLHSSLGAEIRPEEENSVDVSSKVYENLNPKDDELELLQMQLSKAVAVRSGRQMERRVRRARAAENADVDVVSVKPRSSSRKKRAATQDVDYSDPLRYLRGTSSNYRLLTAPEELELSDGIQDLLKLESLHEELAGRCGHQPTFTQWAKAAGIDQKTLRRRLNHGTLCKDKMIKSNLRLVISVAKNYQGVGMNLEDLVQEGCRGLIRGAEKFDASKGCKFSTYAHLWIKQAVQKYLSDRCRTIRLPYYMVDATYRVREAKKQLYSENGRHPDDNEIAKATGLSMKRVMAAQLTPKTPRSLDQKIGIDRNLKPLDVIAHPDAETPEDLLSKQFMKQDLDKILDSLNPREKQVIRWRFGLEDGRDKSLQEIGEIMGVSRERIRQIESCAFRKLKNKTRTKNLHKYLFS